MLRKLINAKRSTKRIISVAYDITVLQLGLYCSLALRLGEITPPINTDLMIASIITSVATVATFIKLGLYRAILRFATLDAVINVCIGVFVSAITLACVGFFLNTSMPRSTPIIFFLTSLLFLGTPRLLFRSLLIFITKHQETFKNKTPIIIYGAGYTGYQLSLALETADSEYKIVAFVDDDKKLNGSRIRNIRAFHSSQLQQLKEQYEIKTVLLALGQTSRSKKSEIITRLEKLKLKALTVPPIADIVSGKANISDIKPVAVEDLLGRDPVPANPALLHACITNKCVMVTGAGGSIGSELCRQILKLSPRKLILFEVSEYNLYAIEQNLQTLNSHNNTKIIPLLGNVQDQSHLETVMASFSVNTVYHAAAYKHVPLVEHNIIAGVTNNVLGTWRCAEAAITTKVESFVLVSTDKAVRPTNIMGTTKRMAELVLQALNQRQFTTRFTMVRFGNVLGSSGSVIPLFRKQIANGGPVTVTHPEITRYFMTIPEAAELVIQAGSMGKGGDVFVLDMGEPVKIIDLAKQLVHLSGLELKEESHHDGDIEIQFTGLRPGEKLYEELLVGDNVSGTQHKLIMRAEEKQLSWSETQHLLEKLETSCISEKQEKVFEILLSAPTDYQGDGVIKDFLSSSAAEDNVIKLHVKQ